MTNCEDIAGTTFLSLIQRKGEGRSSEFSDFRGLDYTFSATGSARMPEGSLSIQNLDRTRLRLLPGFERTRIVNSILLSEDVSCFFDIDHYNARLHPSLQHSQLVDAHKNT